MKELIFNRVLGLKFLYEYFPYYFKKDRIKMFFVENRAELLSLQGPSENYDTIVLKRSGDINKVSLNDKCCKDNRFFSSFDEMKEGSNEFKDIFNFCVECHKFGENENYYSDKLAIVQFSTDLKSETYDNINFIPSFKKGVSTRDNNSYMTITYPYGYGSIFNVEIFDYEEVKQNSFTNFKISTLANSIHNLIENIREELINLGVFNTFQLIIRIDKNLNLLPIDFRTSEAWINTVFRR